MPINPSDITRPALYDTVVRDAQLRERFTGLWFRCLTAGTQSDAIVVWNMLEARYTEPDRHYHGKGHLAYCLEQLDLAAGKVGQPAQVEMAIWFHDIINESGQPDNEARSAAFFRDIADAGMNNEFVAAVVDLILATTHKDPPTDLDQQFICDIDLASFGCTWEYYMQDTTNLKTEFQGPDADYYQRKRAFLEALLHRPKIFLTEFFNDRYERQARDNIRRFLDLINRRQD